MMTNFGFWTLAVVPFLLSISPLDRRVIQPIVEIERPLERDAAVLVAISTDSCRFRLAAQESSRLVRLPHWIRMPCWVGRRGRPYLARLT